MGKEREVLGQGDERVVVGDGIDQGSLVDGDGSTTGTTGIGDDAIGWEVLLPCHEGEGGFRGGDRGSREGGVEELEVREPGLVREGEGMAIWGGAREAASCPPTLEIQGEVGEGEVARLIEEVLEGGVLAIPKRYPSFPNEAIEEDAGEGTGE